MAAGPRIAEDSFFQGERPAGLAGEKRLHDLFVFLGSDAARRIDEPATDAYESGGGVEERQLLQGMLLDVRGLEPPLLCNRLRRRHSLSE